MQGPKAPGYASVVPGMTAPVNPMQAMMMQAPVAGQVVAPQPAPVPQKPVDPMVDLLDMGSAPAQPQAQPVQQTQQP